MKNNQANTALYKMNSVHADNSATLHTELNPCIYTCLHTGLLTDRTQTASCWLRTHQSCQKARDSCPHFPGSLSQNANAVFSCRSVNYKLSVSLSLSWAILVGLEHHGCTHFISSDHD